VSPDAGQPSPGRFARGEERAGSAAARALEAALAEFRAPAQWRALRTRDRLEARWSSESGSWARFSVGIGPVEVEMPEGAIVLQRQIAGGQLTLVFASSDCKPETLAAGTALVEQIERMTDALT